ncbi:hypothetical protein HDE_12839 [Halotydeus destructor]|nr:hypothetical protein HDE_12839 [Halotydeus destructor]
MIGYLNTVPGRRLGRIPGHASKEDIDALRNLLATRPEVAQEQFGPPPVTEPNCYVEVQVTHRMPGKCTKLGGAIPACQARDLIAFDSACETF